MCQGQQWRAGKWSTEYAIEDSFKNDMVFVPAAPHCFCKLFRVQHDDDDPTHELAQIDSARVVLVPLRELEAHAELTFDYWGAEKDFVSSGTVNDSSTTCSQSLSGSSQVVALTGNGKQTTAQLMADMETRMSQLGGAEVCESLAF